MGEAIGGWRRKSRWILIFAACITPMRKIKFMAVIYFTPLRAILTKNRRYRLPKGMNSPGRRFEKGKSGNPKGRPRNAELKARAELLSAEEVLLMNAPKFGMSKTDRVEHRVALATKFEELSTEVLQKLVDKYAHYNRAELEVLYQSPDLVAKDAIAICMILNGVYKSNPMFFGILLDRRLGKVKETVEIKLPEPTMITRLDGATVELGSKMINVTPERIEE